MSNSIYPSINPIIETILENAFEWFVVVDHKGIITYMNRNYCDFLETERDVAVGRHVSEVIENSRMHIVAATGIEEIADLHYIRGNYMIANRIPIFSEGEIVGAFGSVIFRDISEWMKMNSHVKHSISKFQGSIQDLDTGVKYTLKDILGNSQSITALKEKVKMVASSDISVLLRGESGTGKELIAHSLHHLSQRSGKPFVKVNCAAIPEHLLESELFGYEDGAFTGAKKGGKKGKFQLANGGTLFLDEIGDMPLNMQSKLLRVLQEGEIEIIGSSKTVDVDVRIVAATNRPLEKLMEENRFREDLYYRISVIPFLIPPLRERINDIEILTNFFVKKITNKSGRRIVSIDEEVFRLFKTYNWPGNIRELEHTLEASIYLSNQETITLTSLPDYIKHSAGIQKEKKTLKNRLDETEKKILIQSLEFHNGNKKEAARTLGISKTSMYDKCIKYNLS